MYIVSSKAKIQNTTQNWMFWAGLGVGEDMIFWRNQFMNIKLQCVFFMPLLVCRLTNNFTSSLYCTILLLLIFVSHSFGTLLLLLSGCICVWVHAVACYVINLYQNWFDVICDVTLCARNESIWWQRRDELAKWREFTNIYVCVCDLKRMKIQLCTYM